MENPSTSAKGENGRYTVMIKAMSAVIINNLPGLLLINGFFVLTINKISNSVIADSKNHPVRNAGPESRKYKYRT
jgi:hypothetical protein